MTKTMSVVVNGHSSGMCTYYTKLEHMGL